MIIVRNFPLKTQQCRFEGNPPQLLSNTATIITIEKSETRRIEIETNLQKKIYIGQIKPTALIKVGKHLILTFERASGNRPLLITNYNET